MEGVKWWCSGGFVMHTVRADKSVLGGVLDKQARGCKSEVGRGEKRSRPGSLGCVGVDSTVIRVSRVCGNTSRCYHSHGTNFAAASLIN